MLRYAIVTTLFSKPLTSLSFDFSVCHVSSHHLAILPRCCKRQLRSLLVNVNLLLSRLLLRLLRFQLSYFRFQIINSGLESGNMLFQLGHIIGRISAFPWWTPFTSSTWFTLLPDFSLHSLLTPGSNISPGSLWSPQSSFTFRTPDSLYCGVLLQMSDFIKFLVYVIGNGLILIAL